jgi:uncharacterized protein
VRTVRWLRRAGAVLAGRASAELVDALVGQLEATRAGAVLAREMASGTTSRAEAHRRIGEVEHRGDTQRRALVEVLSRTLTPPIDREDMFRLSRSIDDVLDTIRDFVRESDLYAVDGTGSLVPLLDLVVEGVEALERAVRVLPGGARSLLRLALEAKKAAGAVNRAHQYEMARVLDGEVTVDTLKRRELVRRLDTVAQRMSDAADTLADGAVKRWH